MALRPVPAHVSAAAAAACRVRGSRRPFGLQSTLAAAGTGTGMGTVRSRPASQYPRLVASASASASSVPSPAAVSAPPAASAGASSSSIHVEGRQCSSLSRGFSTSASTAAVGRGTPPFGASIRQRRRGQGRAQRRSLAGEAAVGGGEQERQRQSIAAGPDVDAAAQASSPSSASLYDSSPHWSDWFSADEYADAYDATATGLAAGGLEPLDCPELDRPTRHLIALLDDYADGVRRGGDRATTARCNRAIERLSDLSVGGKELEGRAQRADAILRRMERCRATAKSRRGHLKFELPLPNRETYLLVLRLYASPPPSADSPWAAPERAEEIVSMMRAAYVGGDLTLRPDAVIWNQVIAAWAASRHHDKAYRAASVLAEVKAVADSSSYGHVLRACALSYYNDRSKRLGVEVALRVWRDFHGSRTDLPPTSYVYAHFLNVCEYMPEGGPDRDDTVRRAFVKCCDDGLVNVHVLHQLRLAASDGLYRELVGDEVADMMRERGASGGDDVLALKRLPEKWTRNTETSTNRYIEAITNSR